MSAVTRLDSADITGLLKAWGRGDQVALEQLTPLVYAQLRAQARRYMRNERSGVTLQSTALVHEVYLRLINAQDVDWHDRVHFFALSAQIMRRILVDAARARAAAKRGGGGGAARALVSSRPGSDSDRSTRAPRRSARSTMRSRAWRGSIRGARRSSSCGFLEGLSVEETAGSLQVSPQTVMRDWRLARAWLARELRSDR